MSRQKRKGDNYERELADYLRTHLRIDAMRAPLSGGGHTFGGVGGADLTGTPDLHVEAKRTERVSPYKFMEQASKGAAVPRIPEMPVVITRRSRVKTGDSLCILKLDDFMKLYDAWLTQQQHYRIQEETPNDEEPTELLHEESF